MLYRCRYDGWQRGADDERDQTSRDNKSGEVAAPDTGGCPPYEVVGGAALAPDCSADTNVADADA